VFCKRKEKGFSQRRKGATKKYKIVFFAALRRGEKSIFTAENKRVQRGVIFFIHHMVPRG